MILVSLFFFGIASAEISSSTKNKIEQVKQKIEDIRQKAEIEKSKLKEKIASTTVKLDEKKQELKNDIEIKIGKKLDEQKIKIADQFEKIIRNLNDLVVRIESRISKIDASGTDTSVLKALLATAKTNVFLAATELTSLENLLAQNIPTSTNTAEKIQRNSILKSIKIQSDKTKNAIKIAHASIIKVVESLKNDQLKEKYSTSTPQTESTSTNNQ